MHGMRSVAQSVQNKIVESAQEVFRLFRHGAEIGEVCSVAKAKAENGCGAVIRRDGNYFQAEEFKGPVDRVHFHTGHGTDCWSVVEDVGELLAQRGLRFHRGVKRTQAALLKGLRAD